MEKLCASLSMDSDTDLIEKAKAGDDAAFAALLNRHLPALYAFASRYAGDVARADDISQDAWVKIWKNLRRFDSKKHFKTWAFTIVKNTALDYLKKEKRSTPLSRFDTEEGFNPIADTLEDDEALPEKLFQLKELGVVLETTLQKLPDTHREVLLLRYKEELSLEEIATVMNRPINTVKSWHLRGLSSLRKLLPSQK